MRVVLSALMYVLGILTPAQASGAEPKQDITVTCGTMEAFAMEIDSFTNNKIKQQTVFITSPQSSIRVLIVATQGKLSLEVPVQSGRAKSPPEGTRKRLYAYQKPTGDLDEEWIVPQETLAQIRELFAASGLKSEEGYHYSEVEVIKDGHASNVTVDYVHKISAHPGDQRELLLPLVKALLNTVLKISPPYQVKYGRIFT